MQWNGAWILPEPARLCWVPSFPHRNKIKKEEEATVPPLQWQARWLNLSFPLRFFWKQTTQDLFLFFSIFNCFWWFSCSINRPFSCWSKTTIGLHGWQSAMKLYQMLSRLRGCTLAQRLIQATALGRQIAAASCGREPIRIWIVLRREAQHLLPQLYTQKQPAML